MANELSSIPRSYLQARSTLKCAAPDAQKPAKTKQEVSDPRRNSEDNTEKVI